MACAHPDAVDDVLRDRRKPSQGGSASAPPRGIEPRAPTAFLPKGWPSRRELRASRRESEVHGHVVEAAKSLRSKKFETCANAPRAGIRRV